MPHSKVRIIFSWMVKNICSGKRSNPLNIVNIAGWHKLHAIHTIRRALEKLCCSSIACQKDRITRQARLHSPSILVPQIPIRPACCALRGWCKAAKHVKGSGAGDGSSAVKVEVKFARLTIGSGWKSEGQQRGYICGLAVFEDPAIGRIIVDSSSPDIVL